MEYIRLKDASKIKKKEIIYNNYLTRNKSNAFSNTNNSNILPDIKSQKLFKPINNKHDEYLMSNTNPVNNKNLTLSNSTSTPALTNNNT